MKSTWKIWTMVFGFAVVVATMTAYAQEGQRGARSGEGNQAGRMNPAQMFGRMDTNKDGKVSQEEYLANAKAMFARIDKDKDGNLTEEEMAAGRPGGRTEGNEAPAAKKGKKAKEDAGE